MSQEEAPRTAAESAAARWTRRSVNAVRVAVLAGVALGLIGVGGMFAGLPVITSTLGPTAYLFLAHPEHETARLRNACVGQAAAIAAGIIALLITGTMASPLAFTPSRAIASALGLGLTMLALELASSHHAPAASTVLLITTGLASSLATLTGLVAGIAALLPLVLVLSQIPPWRRRRTQPAAEEAVSVDQMSPSAGEGRTAAAPATRRRLLWAARALRMAVLGGMVVGVIGIGARLSGLALLSSSLGPTAYVFFAHPERGSAQVGKAAIAHATAIVAGLVALALLAPIGLTGDRALADALAPGLALALTLLVMDLAGTHHAPAGSTAVLVGSGVAGPGWPLAGLAIGLAALLGLTALLRGVASWFAADASG